MKKIFEKSARGVAKGASEIGGAVLKQTLTALLSEIAKEILSEQGVDNLAKDMIVDTGFKVAKSLNLDANSLKKDFLMAAVRKELGI